MVAPAIYKEVDNLMKQVDKASSKANLLRLRNEAVKLQQSNNAYTESLVNYVNSAIKQAPHNANSNTRSNNSSNTTMHNAGSNQEMYNAFAALPVRLRNGPQNRNGARMLWMQEQLRKYADGTRLNLLNPEPAVRPTLSAIRAAEHARARRVARTKQALDALNRALPNSNLGGRQKQAKNWGKKAMSHIFLNY